MVSEHKVEYNNEVKSLSPIVGAIKSVKSITGPSYFTYNGEMIVNIVARPQQSKERL